MTIRCEGAGRIILEGACPIEDAEVLLACLLAAPDATVDWRGCREAHTAVIQVLLAARKAPEGTPAAAYLAGLVGPALRRAAN